MFDGAHLAGFQTTETQRHGAANASHVGRQRPAEPTRAWKREKHKQVVFSRLRFYRFSRARPPQRGGVRCVLPCCLRSGSPCPLCLRGWTRGRDRSVTANRALRETVESHVLRQLAVTVRGFWRRPAMALTVVATLSLCIGANTAIFSAVDTLLLKPLPYPAADRLVAIHEANWQRRETEGLVAPVRAAEWASAARTLDAIAGCYFENLTDTSAPLPERVEAIRVSPGFLTLFGTSPLLGRTFSPEEERLVAPVAVISEGFWARRYGRDQAVGRQLPLGGRSYTIVGVMPASFQAPDATTEVWAPMPPLTQSREARILTTFGRLKPGMSAADARDRPDTDPGGPRAPVSTDRRRLGRPRHAVERRTGRRDSAFALAPFRRRRRSCSSPRAATWPACCSPTPRGASTKSPCAWPSGPDAARSCASCASKGSCSPAAARRSGCSSRIRACGCCAMPRHSCRA